MTTKQEQKLTAELGKVIVSMGKVLDMANKLGANATAGNIQLHAMQYIKDAIDYHIWHMGEVTKGNIIE